MIRLQVIFISLFVPFAVLRISCKDTLWVLSSEIKMRSVEVTGDVRFALVRLHWHIVFRECICCLKQGPALQTWNRLPSGKYSQGGREAL